MVILSAAPELMRACDGSLEPSWHKNDGSMENFRFARAARPQCAKMCFLLHKLAPNGRFETWTVMKDYKVSQTNDLVKR